MRRGWLEGSRGVRRGKLEGSKDYGDKKIGCEARYEKREIDFSSTN